MTSDQEAVKKWPVSPSSSVMGPGPALHLLAGICSCTSAILEPSLLAHGGGDLWNWFGEPGCPSDIGARLWFREDEKYILNAFWLNSGSSAHPHPTPTVAASTVHCDTRDFEWVDPSLPSVGKCKTHGRSASEQDPARATCLGKWIIACLSWASGLGKQSKTSLAHPILGAFTLALRF